MNVNEITSIASRVILTEAKALHHMANDLPADFAGVVERILQTQGRVIVSGVGKSGHICKKISATMASTGTPASFVHATEASHGDLGMVTAADFCLLISNSGETSELSDIIAHTKRFNIPMAAISSKSNSTLMLAADYKLTLPKASEACLIGMVPTTSTTLTLALGDALAIALMECRDFQPEDFKLLHPGGSLGARLATVSQIMRPKTELAILNPGASMVDLILCMTETGYGIAVLLNGDGSIYGVLTDGDLRRWAKALLDQDPWKIATKQPVVVALTDTIEDAINKMQANKVYSLLVCDNKKPVGLLRMHDLLRLGLV